MDTVRSASGRVMLVAIGAAAPAIPADSDWINPAMPPLPATGPVTVIHFWRSSCVSCVETLRDLDALQTEFGDRLAGVKDSSGDQATLGNFLRMLPNKAVMPGTEHLLLWGLNQGTSGVITSGANVNAAGIRAVWDAFKANDAGAVHLQGQASGLRNAFQGLPMIAALKYYLASRTGQEAWLRMRPPLVPLTGDQQYLLDRKLGLLRR